jgi:hypothetical protein
MKDTLKIIGGLMLAVLMLDALCFMAWVASGQHPVDGFYFGAITANILKVFIH